MVLNFLFLFFKVIFPIYKSKKLVINLCWITTVSIILIENYEFIRYDKVKKNGYQYTYDRFTGNKWKNIN